MLRNIPLKEFRVENSVSVSRLTFLPDRMLLDSSRLQLGFR